MTHGLAVLMFIFLGLAILGAPVGLAMLAAGFAYLFATGQDIGLAVDQTMNSLYNSYVLIAVPLFILVANTMNTGGVIDRLLDFGAAMVGRYRGGLAHVNVIANLIFSGMSGSAVADAAGPGLVIARMMARRGYAPGFAAATSAAAATIGPIVPPSIPMIFYALIANTSVGAMFLGGLVPAALMAAALMACIAVIARKKGLPRGEPVPWRAYPRIFFRAAPPLALPVILLGIIYSGIATPTEAAAVAAFYALLLAHLVYRSAGLADLFAVLAETVRNTATVGLIIVGAFIFNYVIAAENVPQLLQGALTAWHPSALEFLFAVNVIFLALACVLDAITMLLVLVPLLVPLAAALGLDLVHFGVVVILNMMIGLALPPHGLLLFVMHGLTGTPLGAIFREVLPLVGALLVVLIAVTLVPSLVTALPRAFGYAP
jgi:C4-dicarboxylate transporter, DctM subunit